MGYQAPVALKGEGVAKRFGGLQALRGVDFQVRVGEILGLIGPNGAGKTTLINIVSGIYKPDGGRLWFNGLDITGLSPEETCRIGIGRTFQIAQSFPNLTVEENVGVGFVFGKQNSVKGSQESEKRVEEIIKLVGLAAKSDIQAKNLTVAELKKLELARALATQPRLLLLDEIHTGLNLAQIQDAMDLVRKIRGEGITILLVEHNMQIVMNLCERVVVLNYGEKIAEGTPQEVASNQDVIRAYLGEQYL